MHRDAEAKGAERGGSLRRHHLRRVVRRPHLQSVLREGCACRFSLILSTLGDRSNPPPDSDDSDDDLEDDIYGWFNFETDAEGVKRLDRASGCRLPPPL